METVSVRVLASFVPDHFLTSHQSKSGAVRRLPTLKSPMNKPLSCLRLSLISLTVAASSGVALADTSSPVAPKAASNTRTVAAAKSAQSSSSAGLSVSPAEEQTDTKDQILVYVNDAPITAGQLRSALISSPTAVNFASKDEKVQARIRGDLLTRLVASELFRQEALRLGLDKSEDYLKEMHRYRTNVLAQRYLGFLRDSIHLPEGAAADLKKRYAGDSDAQLAAESVYYARRFPALKQQMMDKAFKQYHVKLNAGVLDEAKPDANAVVASGDGFTLHYGDLLLGSVPGYRPVLRDLNAMVETELQAALGAENGVDVKRDVDRYAHQLLSRMLVEQKEKEWVGDDARQEKYFNEHEDIGYIPARWQVAQIVTRTEDEAKKLKARIDNGESLFRLATQYSIDPWGRKNAGQMGWLSEGRGAPALEEVVKGLPDNQVSEPIKSSRGYHLVMVLSRRYPKQRFFDSVKDRVQQRMVEEGMTQYLLDLQKRHKVHWVQ